MKILEQSSWGAKVEICGQTLQFDFRSKSETVEPLFSGVSWGTMLWDASLVLAAVLESCDTLKGKRVVELGACCGLPGMTAALAGARKSVLTDLKAYLPAIEQSIALNSTVLPLDVICSEELEWGEENAYGFVSKHGSADVLLASDCVSTDVYGRASWEALIHVLKIICVGEAWVCSVRRKNDGLDEFIEKVSATFRVHEVLQLPQVCNELFQHLNLSPQDIEIHRFSI